MKFTDEDLKGLEEDLFGYRTGQLTSTQASCPPSMLKALLHRLEAAEYALMRFQIVPPEDRTDGIDEALNLWRTASGKEPKA